jgi:phosphatidylserine/phosphatidylglycerophosphate/cardiolipin synthase-like enzyme
MNTFRVLLGGTVVLATLVHGSADPAPQIHYAPAENLERLDVELIDGAKTSIDFAAYVITDWPVMQALTRAADRGVSIRIYLDGGQLAAHQPAPVFRELAETPGVTIKVKRAGAPLMHIKAYQIDGRLLRTGSANFSASGLKRQDNDLIIIDNPAAAITFKRNFDLIFDKNRIQAFESLDKRPY